MNNLRNITNASIAIQKLNEVYSQSKDIKNSKLTNEQKLEAIDVPKKLILTTFIVVFLACFVMGMSIIFGSTLKNKIGTIIIIASVINTPILLIIYTLFIKKLFPNWYKYYDLVDKGFDGLTSEQINFLTPNEIEIKLIKKLKIKEALALEFYITFIIGEKFMVNHPYVIVFIIVITIIVWYIIQDNYRVEVHRLSSGYYKKDYRYVCQNCKEELMINYMDVEKYNETENYMLCLY